MKPSNSAATGGRIAGEGRRIGYKTYLRGTVTVRTRTLYESDLRHFKKWGGEIPATPARVAGYLARFAGELAVATLARRLIAIGRAHIEHNYTNPTTDHRVKTTFRGIKRAFGTAQKQALPLLLNQLRDVARRCDTSPAGVRDRALLMIGFAAALRRAELVALRAEDLEFVAGGLVLTIPYSKTDQERQGRKIAIPFGKRSFCPVQALQKWLTLSAIERGAIFRRIDRNGHVGASALHPSSVSTILRNRLTIAGLDPAGYSAHSLRAGLATSAAMAGVPTWKIRQQTRHKSDASLARYIRDHQIFENNASAAVFWRRA